MQKKHNFTLHDIEQTLRLKTWWAAAFILPLARRVSLFLANYTEISPNTITLWSFLMRLVSAGFFASGRSGLIIAGAFIFEAAYVLDCVDGSIARLKERFSTMGAFFDHVTDITGVTLNMASLAWGQGILFSPVVFFVISMYLFIHYLTFVANSIFLTEKYRIGKERAETVLDENILKREKNNALSMISDVIVSYRKIFSKRRFKAFFSPPDLEALICFIFPIAGNIRAGFAAGAWFLVMLLVYKMFSYLYVIKVKSEVESELE